LMIGVDADRDTGLGRPAAIAPGVALTLDNTGKESDVSKAERGVFSLEVIGGVKSALRSSGVFSLETTVSANDGRSSGGGLIERRGKEVGELVRSCICLGDSLSTLVDSIFADCGEARPPLLLVLFFNT